jgi:uncharacterized protein YbbK (DUF523 family)
VTDERPTLLVSACLLGTCCNHQGSHSRRSAVEALAGEYRLVPICPEVVGGLPTPRAAAEIVGGSGDDVLAGSARVRTAEGDDVTAEYLRGAQAAVELAHGVGARRAVLKARSPSCGSRQIYDGTWSRSLVDGSGVTAAALRSAGLEVGSEEDC